MLLEILSRFFKKEIKEKIWGSKTIFESKKIWKSRDWEVEHVDSFAKNEDLDLNIHVSRKNIFSSESIDAAVWVSAKAEEDGTLFLKIEVDSLRRK